MSTALHVLAVFRNGRDIRPDAEDVGRHGHADAGQTWGRSRASRSRCRGMLAPTVDLGELDKRITDLRAVAPMAGTHASMLRYDDQTLEVPARDDRDGSRASAARCWPPSWDCLKHRPRSSRPPVPLKSRSAWPAALRSRRPRCRRWPQCRRASASRRRIGTLACRRCVESGAWWHTCRTSSPGLRRGR